MALSDTSAHSYTVATPASATPARPGQLLGALDANAGYDQVGTEGGPSSYFAVRPAVNTAMADAIAAASVTVATSIPKVGQSSGNDATRRGPPSVRRPVLGLVPPKPCFARLEVYGNGPLGDRQLLISSATRQGKDHAVTNFILQSINETAQEPGQVIKTFGINFLSFSGQYVPVIDVTSFLLEADNFPWATEWRHNYTRYLRGSRCALARAEVVLTVGDTQYRGFMMQSVLGRSIQQGSWSLVGLSFNMVLTQPPIDLSPYRAFESDTPFLDSRPAPPTPILKEESEALDLPFTDLMRTLTTQAQRATAEAARAKEGVVPVTPSSMPESGFYWRHDLEVISGQGSYKEDPRNPLTLAATPADISLDLRAQNIAGLTALLEEAGFARTGTPRPSERTTQQERRAARRLARQIERGQAGVEFVET